MHVARRTGGAVDDPDRVPLSARKWSDGSEVRMLGELAGMLALLGHCLRALVTRPFTWRRELVIQSALTVRRCALPVALAAGAFVFGAGVMLSGRVLALIGAEDRLGFGVAIASLREFSSWVTGMVVAGVAGTAICSDLGARKVREEIDALRTLGVDPYRDLVLPRVLALTLMMPVFYIWSTLFAAFVPWLAGPSMIGFPAAAYEYSFSNLVSIDVLAGCVRMTIVGLVAGVVFCFKGINTSGGTEGVGRSVNQAVVIAFVIIWSVNLLFNMTYLAALPDAQNLR